MHPTRPVVTVPVVTVTGTSVLASPLITGTFPSGSVSGVYVPSIKPVMSQSPGLKPALTPPTIASTSFGGLSSSSSAVGLSTSLLAACSTQNGYKPVSPYAAGLGVRRTTFASPSTASFSRSLFAPLGAAHPFRPPLTALRARSDVNPGTDSLSGISSFLTGASVSASSALASSVPNVDSIGTKLAPAPRMLPSTTTLAVTTTATTMTTHNNKHHNHHNHSSIKDTDNDPDSDSTITRKSGTETFALPMESLNSVGDNLSPTSFNSLSALMALSNATAGRSNSRSISVASSNEDSTSNLTLKDRLKSLQSGTFLGMLGKKNRSASTGGEGVGRGGGGGGGGPSTVLLPKLSNERRDILDKLLADATQSGPLDAVLPGTSSPGSPGTKKRKEKGTPWGKRTAGSKKGVKRGRYAPRKLKKLAGGGSITLEFEHSSDLVQVPPPQEKPFTGLSALLMKGSPKKAPVDTALSRVDAGDVPSAYQICCSWMPPMTTAYIRQMLSTLVKRRSVFGLGIHRQDLTALGSNRTDAGAFLDEDGRFGGQGAEADDNGQHVYGVHGVGSKRKSSYEGRMMGDPYGGYGYPFNPEDKVDEENDDDDQGVDGKKAATETTKSAAVRLGSPLKRMRRESNTPVPMTLSSKASVMSSPAKSTASLSAMSPVQQRMRVKSKVVEYMNQGVFSMRTVMQMSGDKMVQRADMKVPGIASFFETLQQQKPTKILQRMPHTIPATG